MLRSILRDAAPNNFKFSALVLGIVKSPAFQMNMKLRGGPPVAANVTADKTARGRIAITV